MADMLEVPIKNVGRHEDCVVFVIFLTREIENSLYAIRSVPFWEYGWRLTQTSALIRLELQESRVQMWVQVVVQGVSLLLRAHSQVRGLRVLWKMLIDITDINAAIEIWVMILYIILVSRRQLCRRGTPSWPHDITWVGDRLDYVGFSGTSKLPFGGAFILDWRVKEGVVQLWADW